MKLNPKNYPAPGGKTIPRHGTSQKYKEKT